MFSPRNVTRCGNSWIPAQGRKDEREAWRDARDRLADSDNLMTLMSPPVERVSLVL